MQTTPVILELLIVLLAACAAWHLPLPLQYHPLVVFRALCQRLVKRVNPDPNRSEIQLKTSGVLAVTVFIGPWLLILFIFRQLVEFVWLFDFLILYFCLEPKPLHTGHQQVTNALTKQQKLLARDWLSEWVLRDVDRLSEVGIAKASIESYLLNIQQRFFAILFWYFVGGSLAALAVALIFCFYQQSNPKIDAFSTFSKPLAGIVQCLLWPVAVILSVLLLAVSKPTKLVDLSIWHFCPKRLLLHAGALLLNCQLSGPAFYCGEKRQSERFGAARLPQVADIQLLFKIMVRIQLVLLLIIVIILTGIMIFALYPA
ncbi:cobalamin biosynthesis protein CobD/CbiB [Gayadomonas joobiniege]|uniref:cobalamin biosynthesis protein CobD/CbiB n=1 Tax=Gayadomonas joobiniege TaxID=1234606 RepID=UPI0003773199|nr:cobalamin biosynthesis protein [Gayadomonas joobiniege]